MYNFNIFFKNQYIKFYFIFFALLHTPLFYYLYELNTSGGDYWLSADWLINYDHGFIRRGAFGSLLNIFSIDQKQKFLILTTILILFYLIILYQTYKIFISSRQTFVSIMLLFSPFFIMFPLYDFRGSFRKEILGFLSYLLIIRFLINYQNNYKRYFLLCLYVFSIFSSEVNFLFLPFIIIFIYKKTENTYKKQILFEYIIASFIYILIFLIYQNNFTQSLILICEDLINNNSNPEICNGSIRFMKLNLTESIFYNLDSIYIQKILSYFIFFFLGFLPFFADMQWLKDNKIYISIAAFFYLPFFIISMDWGRWLHIFFSCLTLNYFLHDKKIKPKNLSYLHIFLYTMTWNVNHYYENFETLLVNLIEFNFIRYLSQVVEFSKLF